MSSPHHPPVSTKVITKFNAAVQKLTELLEKEFPTSKDVKVLKIQANMALKLTAKKDTLYNLFCAHVKPEHTMKIMTNDTSFVEDAKKELQDDEEAAPFLPTVAALWEQGGKETPNVSHLQKKIVKSLQNICIATMPEPPAAVLPGPAAPHQQQQQRQSATTGGKITAAHPIAGKTYCRPKTVYQRPTVATKSATTSPAVSR